MIDTTMAEVIECFADELHEVNEQIEAQTAKLQRLLEQREQLEHLARRAAERIAERFEVIA